MLRFNVGRKLKLCPNKKNIGNENQETFASNFKRFKRQLYDVKVTPGLLI